MEAAREKVQVPHKGSSIRIASELSVECVKARRPWYKDYRRQPRQTTTPKETAMMEGETSRDKAAFKELTFAKSALQRILERTLQCEEIKHTQEYRE